jgi:hypothetical protein
MTEVVSLIVAVSVEQRELRGKAGRAQSTEGTKRGTPTWVAVRYWAVASLV